MSSGAIPIPAGATIGDPVPIPQGATVGKPKQPGISERYSEVLTGTQHPVQQAKSELQQLAQHPIKTLGSTAKSAAMMPVYLAYDLVHHPIKTVTGMTGGPQFQEDWRNKNWRGMIGDLLAAGTIGATTAGLPESTGTKIAPEPKDVAETFAESGTPEDYRVPRGAQLLKPSEQAGLKDAYVHTKGIQLARKIDNAVQAVHDEVGVHANHIANVIDTAHPEGIIDASKLKGEINSAFANIVQTPESSSFLKDVNTEIRNSAAQLPNRWTWRQAQQMRTKLGPMLDSTRNTPAVNAFLRKAYGQLTDTLRTTAEDAGLKKDWDTYNSLHRNLESNFGELAGKIAESNSGRQFYKALDADKGLTREFLDNLKKYGVNQKEIANYQKIAAEQMRSPWRKSVFRLVYGSPAGLAGYMAGHMAGLPWIGSLGLGAGAGGLSEYIRSLRAALKIDPDEIESFMNSPARALAGRSEVAEPAAQFLEAAKPKPVAPQVLPKPTPYVPSEAEILRSRVPLELRPSATENPMVEALSSILKETETPQDRQQLASELQRELMKKASTAREKAAIREAMAEIRKAKK